MAERLYLAYGSNLNLTHMGACCPGAKALGTAGIANWRLAFCGCGGGNYLTIQPAPGFTVPVAVWAITPKDELALDEYEDYPALYYKQDMPITYQAPGPGRLCQGDAFIYIMVEGCRKGLPTPRYMDDCLAGYRAFGFDPALLHQAYAYSASH